MNLKSTLIGLSLLSIVIIGCNSSNSADSYTLVQDWPHLPENIVLGNPAGLGIDSHNNLVVFHRANQVVGGSAPLKKIQQNTVLTIDSRSGEVINQWGANRFLLPHGLTVDGEDNVWVTDIGLQQVFKFSKDGKLLMTLGEAKAAGNDSTHFDRPTDVAVVPDGSFYVSDGYGNSRVIKFSPDGRFLFQWGKKGNAPGEFNLPHSVHLDEQGNVYVADRANDRVQKFDADGNFLSLWQDPYPGEVYAVALDNQKQHLFATDYVTVNDTLVKGSDIFRFGLDLNKEMEFGRTGSYEGPLTQYHDIVLDSEGNLYVGDILKNRIQKFQRNQN